MLSKTVYVVVFYITINGKEFLVEIVFCLFFNPLKRKLSALYR